MKMTIDTAHSGIHFAVRHMMFAKVRGAFTKWQGTLVYDPEDPAAGKVDVRIDAASIDTKEPKRDAHLRSPDFLSAERFPEIHFVSGRVDKHGDHYRVEGGLTLRGVTRPVTLEAEYLGTGKDPWGNERVAFEAKTRINRKDFGLTWNQALETGGILVGDEVEISLEIQAMKAQALAA
jgi:polyisoprenoid-binding protein YceI